ALPALDDVAHDDLVDPRAGDRGPLHRLPDRGRAQVRGLERREPAEELADRGARRPHDEHVRSAGHRDASWAEKARQGSRMASGAWPRRGWCRTELPKRADTTRTAAARHAAPVRSSARAAERSVTALEPGARPLGEPRAERERWVGIVERAGDRL